MAEKRNLKIEINKQTIKLFLDKFRKKISRSYLLIEFGFDYINFCEVLNSNGSLNFNKVKHLEIPKEALDKGIPTEPELMGKLISDLLIEENIATKRVAIVISPDSVYTRLIEVPKTIKENKVYEYLCDPKSLVQIPIQLNKSDFTISKTNFCENSINNLYFLIAIPKVSMNNLIKTFEVANLEIHFVETAFNSTERLINKKRIKDNNKEYLLFLDFAKQCTFLTISDGYGPLYSGRISSIRSFPIKIGELNSEENNEYLPISKYDIKVLSREIKSSLNNFFKEDKSELDFKMILSGFYSSHPNLTKVLSDYIKLPTYLIAPSSSKDIGNIKYSDDKFYEAIFTNIFGLGLGLLEKNKDYNNIQDQDYLLNFIEYSNPSSKSNLIKKSSNLDSIKESKNKSGKDEFKKQIVEDEDINKTSFIYDGNDVKKKIKNKDHNPAEDLNFDNQSINDSLGELSSPLSSNKTQEKNKIVEDIYLNENKLINDEIDPNKDLNSSRENPNNNKKEKIDTKSEFKLDTDFLDL